MSLSFKNLKLASGKTGPQKGFKGQGIDISELIGGPLMAATEANGMMLSQQANFILETCFKKDKDTGNLQPIIIPLNMKRSTVVDGKDGENKIEDTTLQFDLPLITIIPLNTIAVQKVSLDYELEIVNQYTSNESSQNQSENNKTTTGVPKKGITKLYGKVSYDSKERTNDASSRQTNNTNRQKLTVSIEAGQIPLPGGTRAMLELYTKSIVQTPKNEDQE